MLTPAENPRLVDRTVEILSGSARVHVVGYLHPFRSDRMETTVDAGLSIAEILDQVIGGRQFSRFATQLDVFVDGDPVERKYWRGLRPHAGRTVAFHTVPAGSDITRALLGIAVTIAALVAAGPIGAALFPAAFMTVGTALISTGMVPVGALAVDCRLTEGDPCADHPAAAAQRRADREG